MTREFCTDRAIACGEPLAGTGAIAERHLFLVWPKTKWRRPRFESEGFTPELTAAMRATSSAKSYVGLIAGDGEELVLRSYPDNRRMTARDQSHLAEIILAWGRGEPLAGESSNRRAILCCTDARTDACCARYGFPLFKALSSAAPSFDIDILQCTHVGGCHFAPSVTVMPNRHRYGRLSPTDVPAFLEAISSDELYLPNYRGNPQLSEVEQAAELAAHLQNPSASQSDVIVLGTEEAGKGAVVRLEVRGAPTEVRLQRTDFAIHSNCRNLDGPPKLVSRWLAEK